MKNARKAVIAGLCTVMAAGGFGAAYADEDISVRMDAVVSGGSEYVTFGEVKPMQIENRTLIPARAMAEAAGMEVTWDQPTQTALLTLRADKNSDKPIERYAAELFDGISGFGLDLEPSGISAALKLENSTAVIRFNFIDSEGDTVAFGKDYQMVSKTVLIDDGTLMVPVRDSMEMFGLKVGWNQEELCAYVSMPDTAEVPEGLKIVSNHGEGEYAAGNDENDDTNSYEVNTGDDVELGEYIGNFKITHYCPCSICNGGYGAYTAWAGELIPGQTIAVNPNIIPKLSWVYVEGYGVRRAEDTGSGIGEYHIDMAVPTHKMAMELGVVYRDVYFVN